MKYIQAIIEPDRLDAVTEALAKRGVVRMTVSEVDGAGHQEGHEEIAGTNVELHFLPKVRIEIACNDAFLEPTIAGITEGSGEASVGVGKILVMNLEEAVRIRTGERGPEAI